MVSEQLLANVSTDIKFFRRNRVLLGASILYLAITGLSLIPALVFMSNTQEFTILKALHDSLSTAVTICVAMMGLLFMSSHFRNRNVKMVLTKPCTPETWLAGVLVSAGGVLLALQLLVVALTGILFAIWGIPFQVGLFYVTMANFLSDMVVLSFVILLATVMPPVLAAIVAVIANEGAIHGLRMIVTAGQDASGSVGLSVLDKILYAVYMMLPSYSFMQDRSQIAFSTWRVEPADWLNLVFNFGYTFAIVMLFYLVTLVALRRKSLG